FGGLQNGHFGSDPTSLCSRPAGAPDLVAAATTSRNPMRRCGAACGYSAASAEFPCDFNDGPRKAYLAIRPRKIRALGVWGRAEKPQRWFSSFFKFVCARAERGRRRRPDPPARARRGGDAFGASIAFSNPLRARHGIICRRNTGRAVRTHARAR